MTCPCDIPVHPAPPPIAAGLPRFRRAIAGFQAFRRALIGDAARAPALADWLAREADDLGLLLLDFAAYVATVQAFYDEVHANEFYLRTARRPESLRLLVDGIGHVPAPATAASAYLAIEVSGRLPALLPAGTAFRSGAFDDQAPQIFELTRAVRLHPELNRLAIGRRPAALAGSTTVSVSGFTVSRASRLVSGDVVVVRLPGDTVELRRVAVLNPGADPATRELVLSAPTIALPAGTTAADVALLRPGLTAGLWTLPPLAGDPIAVDALARVLVLNGLQRSLRPGDIVIGARGSDIRWDTVASVRDVARVVQAAGTVSTTNEDDDTVEVTVPALTALTTELTLANGFNSTARKPVGGGDWLPGDVNTIVLSFGLQPAATVVSLGSSAVSAITGATLPLAVPAGGLLAPDDGDGGRAVALTDARDRSIIADAVVDAASGTLTVGEVLSEPQTLTPPVAVRGNLIEVSRGETVAAEILGSGDAGLANQSFTLKKKPLTYLARLGGDGTAGATSTLAVRVDGLLWTEVPSFWGRGSGDRVYVVRTAGDGAATVTFGDGVRGARLPTGRDNVVASYRFGAGAAAPPAGSIVQTASAVPRVAGVRQPVAAFGGADAETEAALRDAAPRSALLLDRLVSIRDVEAAAALQPGVEAAMATWRWHPARQRPVLQVWYIGAAALAPRISAKLRSLAEPGLALAVDPAMAVPLPLAIGFAVVEGLEASSRTAAVRAALTDPASGPLAVNRIGIGQVLYRSVITAAVLAVPDVVAVTDIAIGGVAFPQFALPAVEGGFYDVRGRLALNGEVG